MGNISDHSKVHVRAAAGSITGSIQRICGGKTNSGVPNTSEITDFKSGVFHSLKYDDGSTADTTGSQNELHQDSTTSFHVAGGACIDGPFIAVGTAADPVIVYHHGGLIVNDD